MSKMKTSLRRSGGSGSRTVKISMTSWIGSIRDRSAGPSGRHGSLRSRSGTKASLDCRSQRGRAMVWMEEEEAREERAREEKERRVKEGKERA